MFGPISKYKVFLPALLLAWPLYAHGNIVINEIMYDLSGADSSHEWIEIYNNGPSDITVIGGGANTAWRFSDGSQHTLTLVNGIATIAAGAYAVIADNALAFLADWPSFSGTLFDSSFSLNNTGATLSILSSKDGTVLDQVTYSSSQGANGDGNSLGLQTDASWKPALPTPGLLNNVFSTPEMSTATTTEETEDSGTATTTPSDTSLTSSASSVHFSSTGLSIKKPETPLTLSAGRDRLGAVGSPLEFKAETNFTYLRNGEFKWNFGDGAEARGDMATHTYEYPGEYVVVLNTSFPEGVAVARTNVKVIEPSLAITFANSERIEVRNSSLEEVSLFGRVLWSTGKAFVFPQDTIIRAGQSISFSSRVTGLNPNTASDVTLLVVGDTEQPHMGQRIEAEREARIKDLEEQISFLEHSLALMPRSAPPEPVAEEVPPAEPLAIQEPETETASADTGWLEVLKHFFMNTQ